MSQTLTRVALISFEDELEKLAGLPRNALQTYRKINARASLGAFMPGWTPAKQRADDAARKFLDNRINAERMGRYASKAKDPSNRAFFKEEGQTARALSR